MIQRFDAFVSGITSCYKYIQRIKSMEMTEFGLKGTHVRCLYYLRQNGADRRPDPGRIPAEAVRNGFGYEKTAEPLALLFSDCRRTCFLGSPKGELSCDSMTERGYRIFALQIFDIYGFSLKIQNPLRPAEAGHLSQRERQGPF